MMARMDENDMSKVCEGDSEFGRGRYGRILLVALITSKKMAYNLHP